MRSSPQIQKKGMRVIEPQPFSARKFRFSEVLPCRSANPVWGWKLRK